MNQRTVVKIISVLLIVGAVVTIVLVTIGYPIIYILLSGTSDIVSQQRFGPPQSIYERLAAIIFDNLLFFGLGVFQFIVGLKLWKLRSWSRVVAGIWFGIASLYVLGISLWKVFLYFFRNLYSWVSLDWWLVLGLLVIAAILGILISCLLLFNKNTKLLFIK